jgi:protein-disulfide isomerase
MLVLPAAALAAAIVVVGALKDPPPRTKVRSPRAVNALFAGIPQAGEHLGSSRAPVRLVEFADLQCPYCAQWERTTLPVIVRRYVRTGKVQMEFRGLRFLGPDSDKAVRAAVAAGEQGKLWNVVQSLYERQGGENSGWVTDEVLTQVGEAVPGLNTDRMLGVLGSPKVVNTVLQNERLAKRLGVHSTPTFFVARLGQPLQEVRLRSLDPSGIEPTLRRLLRQ